MQLDDTIATVDDGAVLEHQTAAPVMREPEAQHAIRPHRSRVHRPFQEVVPPDPNAQHADRTALASATQSRQCPPDVAEQHPQPAPKGSTHSASMSRY